MERYTLGYFYTGEESPETAFTSDLSSHVDTSMTMGVMTKDNISEVITFLGHAIYGYFYNSLIVYPIDEPEDYSVFLNRIGYDISIKLPYWYKKYHLIKKLLTTEDISLLQTSKMTSSSSDTTKSASGTLQKTATTPTGVSADTSTDSFDIEVSETSGVMTGEVDTTGFADKYTNAQQKFANAGKVEGERSGQVLREGSIDELLNVLEKLPSSFADEITKDLQKHFIFDFDGEEKGIYDNV